ncbi:MAG: hypothetical protein Q8N99_04905 [Nanoarchaeota archaeon]|nr:hypothetical protein [Nanoarchaeota archaeon]
MAQKIRAIFIFEILGRPPEHIKEALDQFVSKLGEQNGIELVSKTIAEPKKVEEEGAKDLYTTFAEVEVIIDSLSLLFAVILNMLPSNVEILQPEELKISNFNLNSILTELSIKLHRYDEVAKTLTIERENLIAQLKQAINNQNSMSSAYTPNITFSGGKQEQKKGIDKKNQTNKKKNKSKTKNNKKKKKVK